MQVRVAPEDLTGSDVRKTLPGEGMPLHGRPLERGDLHIQISVHQNVLADADPRAPVDLADDEALVRLLQVGR